MAVIKRGILGGFQNKIGNVVGSSWKGISTMRALPISVANPRTAAQTGQRTKFGAVARMASAILPTIVKPLWDRFAQRESGYNAFIRTNIPQFENSGVYTVDQLVMSKGVLAPAVPLTATFNDATNVLTVTWTPAPVGDGLPTDRLYVALFTDLQDQEPIGFADVAARSAGTATMGSIALEPGYSEIHVYLSFKSLDGTKVSNSSYILGSVI